MNIWRTVRRELAAACRSLRYDLRGPSRAGTPTEVIPRVTADAEEHPEYQAYARRTRRTPAALAVAALSVGGAATTYFGVVGGLTALVADEDAPPAALPGVAGERPPADRLPVGAGSRASGPATDLPSMRVPDPGLATSTEPDDRRESRPQAPVPESSPTATGGPPVPTPAPEPTPTCGCPQPTPTETPSPTPSPSPSPTDPPATPEPPEWAVAPAS